MTWVSVMASIWITPRVTTKLRLDLSTRVTAWVSKLSESRPGVVLVKKMTSG